MNDNAILKELGLRLQRERLNQNMTQADLAQKAGVSRRALQNLEAGQVGTTAHLIRALRALEKLDGLDSFLPEQGPSPIQLAKLKGRQRVRASGLRSKDDKGSV